VEVTGEYADANVGTHDIVLTSSNKNYEISSEIASKGTISCKPLAVAWEGNAHRFTYNGTPQGVSVVVSGMVLGKEEGVNVTGFVEGRLPDTLEDSFSAVNAGTYSVTISLLEGDGSNYTLNGAVTTAGWIIDQKELSIEWQKDEKGSESDDDYVFDFVEYTVVYANVERSVTPKVSGIIGEDDVTYTITGSSAINAGNYVSMVSSLDGTAKNNYKLPSVNSINWSIVKADIEGISMSDASVVYDAKEHTITVSTTNSQHGLPLNVTYNLAGETTGGEQVNESTNGATNAGTYVVTATFAESENYNALELTADLVIDRAEVTGIEFENGEYVYDKEAKSLSVNSLKTTLGDTVTANYRIVGETLGGTQVDREGNSAVEAGEYSVTVTLNAGNNYKVMEPITRTLTVMPREISVTWTMLPSNTGIYNGLAQGVTLVLSNAIDEDDVSVNLKKTFAGNVTNEEITVSVAPSTTSHTAINASITEYQLIITSLLGDDKSNYVLPSNVDASFIISKRTLEIIAWSDGDNLYQNNEEITFIYAKTTYTLEPVLKEGGIVNGEEELVEIEVSGDYGAQDAGEYTATARLVDNGNYEMSVSNRDWTIKAREVNIAWTDKTTKVYNKQIQSVEATIVGLIDDDTATLSYSGASAEAVGNYVASVTGITDNHNYVLVN
ncbi:MAG: hypothetical protein IKB56_03250, partial [Clostridia bacterium]|nr:hypothetical protein [Clostridia bacterium]